ncbi:MAG: Patatin [Actinomycetota bacterium]|nr:Patatin [Actinomycetota bacterium]
MLKPGYEEAVHMRIGLVLGGGGLTGGAFHAGVVAALAEAGGWDARTAGVLLGTSAGSITATSLAAGMPPADLAARALGQELSPAGAAILARVSPGAREFAASEAASRAPASPDLLRAMARDPLQAHPGKVVAAALPEGRISTAPIARSMGELCTGSWPSTRLRLTAFRLSDGQTVVFGRPGAPPPPIGSAVAASCAIPGYFTPVNIDGERYVDGGTTSACNADAVMHEDVDVVIVSAPMAIHSGVTLAPDVPWRRVMRRQVDREITRLRAAGKDVFLFAPGKAEISAMGPNPMAPGREAAVTAATVEAATARIAADSRLRDLGGS